MKAYVTEFIGTFFLVFSIYLTVSADLAVAPLAIGATLMVMVYMGGHISGAHYNPAVSLACLIRGALKPKDFVPYLVAQLAGALCASLIGHYITGKGFAPAPGAMVETGPALLVEILYTFALALVVLNVATSKKTEGNSFYGLAIGFTIAAAAFAGGGISGGNLLMVRFSVIPGFSNIYATAFFLAHVSFCPVVHSDDSGCSCFRLAKIDCSPLIVLGSHGRSSGVCS